MQQSIVHVRKLVLLLFLTTTYFLDGLEKYDEITVKMDPSGVVVTFNRGGNIVRTEIHPQNILKQIGIVYENTDEEWDNSR